MARIGNLASSVGPVKVKMTKTTQASPNGFKVEQFYEGQEYTLSPTLQKALAGAYVKVEEETSQEPAKTEVKEKEKKNAGAAPKNKATSPKENK